MTDDLSKYELIADCAAAAERNAITELVAMVRDVRKGADAVCDSYAEENQRLYDRAEAAEAENAKLRAALYNLISYGCPACGGDCGAASPPVACCPMLEAREALGKD